MEQPNNPLHGITLQTIVEELVERHGWFELGDLVRIRCFTHDPSIRSSLKFLRKTPWAREQVEALYLKGLRSKDRRRKQNRRRAERRAFRAESEAASTEAPEGSPVLDD